MIKHTTVYYIISTDSFNMLINSKTTNIVTSYDIERYSREFK